MNSPRGFLLSIVVLVLFSTLAYSQLTFSPYWGKRSSNDLAGLFEPQKGSCKDANEVLADIIRFMQMKAQFYSDCHRGQ